MNTIHELHPSPIDTAYHTTGKDDTYGEQCLDAALA
jgi:hypothetical protein